MILSELTARFQTLCNNGYSLHELYAEVDGKPIKIEDLKLEVPSTITSDGFITISLNKDKFIDNPMDDDLK